MNKRSVTRLFDQAIADDRTRVVYKSPPEKSRRIACFLHVREIPIERAFFADRSNVVGAAELAAAVLDCIKRRDAQGSLIAALSHHRGNDCLLVEYVVQAGDRILSDAELRAAIKKGIDWIVENCESYVPPVATTSVSIVLTALPKSARMLSLERKHSPASAAAAETATNRVFDSCDVRYHKLREWYRKKMQSILNSLGGRELPSLESKQRLASEIRRHLRRMQFSIACPQCGQPSMIRAAIAGKMGSGLFQFDHSAGRARSTHGGTAKFPEGLQVVDALPDQREKSLVSETRKPPVV